MSVMAHDYSRLHYTSLSQAFVDAEVAIKNLPDGRAKSLALTKLEEAYLWAREA
ncbi:hypothetical protein SEA_PHINKBODEN_12 [Gordonia Phage PhinkBoden]|nr:hypothetical protein SEA_PHINKBODEN_12 [Gordonia Phage PhinkBoden]